MAHPKLATAVQRSLLTATTAALMVGPLAGAGLAQDAVIDPLLNLTCEEAKATENDELRELYVEEFCTDAEAEATESPLDKSVDEVTGTVDKALGDAGAVAPDDETGGDGEGGGSGGGGVLPAPDTDNPTNKKKVSTTGGDGGFTGVSEGGTTDGRNQAPAGVRGAGAVGYNTNGPILPGMRSNSSLTLQPFAAPLVSVPPVYDLPQIASSLFGGDAATAEDPLVAGAATATSASAANGFTATADPTGWLAATATGRIMLVGAGHAINGGRTPKRRKA